MTYNELYRQGIQLLKDAGIEDAKFDAKVLIEYLLNCNKKSFVCIFYDLNAVENDIENYLRLINRRISGEPLQYIVGKWDFWNTSFYVGEGVLIPRPETEGLVDYSLRYLKTIQKENPIVFDLCSGTGCVAVSVAELFRKAQVYAVEKYDAAFAYLQKNIRVRYGNIKAVQGDIFDSTLLRDVVPDLILCNPPYIRSADIPNLQKEVRYEPVTALDGGIDGYDFYRVLASDWLQRLPKGRAMAVECAEDQADEISRMFSIPGSTVEIKKDFSGLPRIVTVLK